MGCGGVMASLTRSRVGEFRIEEAHTLGELQKYADGDRLGELVVPVERMFEGLPKITVKESARKALQNGNQMKSSDFAEWNKDANASLTLYDGREFRVYSHEKVFFGIYRYEQKRKLFCPVKLFFTQ